MGSFHHGVYCPLESASGRAERHGGAGRACKQFWFIERKNLSISWQKRKGGPKGGVLPLPGYGALCSQWVGGTGKVCGQGGP
jgi:hypothetical protein